MTDGPVFCRFCNEPIYLEPGVDGFPAYWREYPPENYPEACVGSGWKGRVNAAGETSHEPPLDLPPATDRTSVEEWLDA